MTVQSIIATLEHEIVKLQRMRELVAGIGVETETRLHNPDRAFGTQEHFEQKHDSDK
jgi:hypothetical protein